METEITIENLQKRISLNPTRTIRTIKKILEFEGVKGDALSFVFVSDRKIKSLNHQFLKRDHPTDVLAFDLTGVTRLKRRPKGRIRKINGEVIISTDTVIRNAKIFGTRPHQELNLCIVHGILHLLGYDDHKASDVKRMRRRERVLLNLIRS